MTKEETLAVAAMDAFRAIRSSDALDKRRSDRRFCRGEIDRIVAETATEYDVEAEEVRGEMIRLLGNAP